MSRDESRRPARRGKAAAVAEKPSRVPSEVARAAASAVAPERAERRSTASQVKDRIVARLKRLHPMD